MGVYSLEDGTTYWPREITVQTDPTGPPFVDAPEFVGSQTFTSSQIKVHCASEEYGPISHYWLIVVPTNYSKEDVINVESGQLVRSTSQYRSVKAANSSSTAPKRKKDIGEKSKRQALAGAGRKLDGIYIAAQLPSYKVQRLYREDRSFILGDGREYDGYFNFPLDDSQHYSVMTRAFAKEDTWRSAAADNPFDYRPPMQEPANR